jgi:hypothetical protein
MARRLPENQFRRLHLNQWTTGRDVAFPEGVWACAAADVDAPDGTEVVIAFVAARQRDTVALVGCTLDSPHVFQVRVWEESERVDPSDVADELRAVWARYDVRDLVCSQHDWSWVLLALQEEGLPVTMVPRSPQRLALEWQTFFDAIMERRVTHDPDPVLARHAGNLALISGPSGLRPDLDVQEGQPVAAALGAMIAFDGVVRIGPGAEPMIVLPSAVVGWGDAASLSCRYTRNGRRASMFGPKKKGRPGRSHMPTTARS